ncbi:HET domain-containing protein [Microdochium nivale]|nr:HET domain-containing protein [Microdochium nivale]
MLDDMRSWGINYFSVFYILGDNPERKQRLSLPSTMGPSTGDLGTRQTMEGWMRECLENHTRCQRRRTAQTGYRPTRLLELSPHGTYRLVDGIDCPTVMRYVALSYCWGNQPVEGLLRLLQTTSQLLYEKRPINTLPKTFREAAQIAQWFGVDYLWIDRLCIYQDSAQDWQREAGTMKDVYHNAEFSIAALGARDSDGGCFFQRDLLKLTFTIVRMKLAEADPPIAITCAEDGVPDWERTFEHDPLMSRSWVVQERVLAPRTLYLGSRQVFWECCEKGYAETDPSNNISTMRIYENIGSWKEPLGFICQLDSGNPYEQLLDTWNALVEDYSTRRLTMPADKLIAISGLAKDMQATLCAVKPGPHRYLAGLWEECFIDALSWSVYWPIYRVPAYRAPSWSWACLDGSVSITLTSVKDDFGWLSTLEATDMVYGNDDETGKVLSGSITLRGPCSKAKMSLTTFRHDNWREVVRVEGHDGDILGEIEASSSPQNRAIFDTLDDVTEEALVIWLAYEWFYNQFQYVVHGLILAPLGDGTYRRLGVATLFLKQKMSIYIFRNSLDKRSMVIV